MITENQVDELSRMFLIDNFTIMREYLQLIFLSYLYREKEGKNIFFKGGTAIRLLFNSPRFSEDLDFSTAYNKTEIIDTVERLEKSIRMEIPDIHILLLYSGKDTTRFRIKYLSEDFKYPLVVRLDFHHEKKIGKTSVTPLVTRFPVQIFPIISHLKEETILKEKLLALMTRGKGRDFFDVWYLLEKGIKIDYMFNKQAIINKIKQYPQSRLDKDLSQFLPSPQREITKLLKNRLISKFSEEFLDTLGK